MSFSIIGVGSAVGSLIKTNDDLARILDTDDEWIYSKTGIRKRHLLGEETLTDLAADAAEKALADSGVLPEELSLIICATVTADYITPSMASVIQRRIGAVCPAFDISAACAGFLYGMDIAEGYFLRDPDSKILLIGAEAVSKMANWQDRSTAVLFGDGAGAVILGKGDGLKAVHLTTKGDEAPLYARAQKGNCPYREERVPSENFTQNLAGFAGDTYLHMAGQKVFQFAVSAMCRELEEVIRRADIRWEEIDYVLPHQANQRIIDYAVSRLPIPREKYLGNISEYGNTSAASIPIMLDAFSREEILKKGDLLAFVSFGAGMVSAAALVKWQGSGK